MRKWQVLAMGSLAFSVVACSTELQSAFLTVTEEFGNLSGLDSDDGGSGSGGGNGGTGTARFRDEMNVTITNGVLEINGSNVELNTSLVAWVLPSSIRSAEQQDALLAGGYVQISSEISLGTAFALPPGTFILNGDGRAGARRVLINGGESESITLITPDAILFFDQPPVSCDSVAFYFTENGFLVDEFESGDQQFFDSGAIGPRKVLAQIDAYQCQPLRPGLFLRTTGGAAEPNEFREGQDIQATFSIGRLPNGFFTQILIN
ncbi:MAG: hypothetical protein ACKVS9_18885 [Phycisphaerae bacterium]